MNHDDAHGLRVQLATALRQRDEARERTNALGASLAEHSKARFAAESERDALRADRDHLHKRLGEANDANTRLRRSLRQIESAMTIELSFESIAKDMLRIARAALASGGDRT